MNLLKEVFGIDLSPLLSDSSKPRIINTPEFTPSEIAEKPQKAIAPIRVSDPGFYGDGLYNFETDKKMVNPGYQYEIIPLIRRLSINNQSVSQALSNIVNLANTGHEVTFDASVPPDQVIAMRAHLDEVIPTWLYGIADKDGLANKLISQAMISGAVCGEAVVNLKLNGIYRFVMPLPESIRFIYNKKSITYEPYQRPRGFNLDDDSDEFGLKKLNHNSFKYFAINGDTESPYGNPPYLPAIGPLEDQKIMLENIKFIIKQVGIMGFWEVLVDEPAQINLENDKDYANRCRAYLQEVKDNMKNSYRDGMMVGFEDKHTFKFNTATASAGGVAELFTQNQQLVSSGLKQPPELSGATDGSGTDSGNSIQFTKLLSELKNIQQTAAALLKFLYDLEFSLKGFKYKTITVKFGQSTIQDDLKLQQGQEIKIRNARQKRADGIIDADQHAQELGHEKPARTSPDPKFQPIKGSSGDPNLDAQKKSVKEKAKDVSDKKVRKKNNPKQ